MDSEDKLREEIRKLEEALKDRERALPAHSIRPHQLLIIEELEEAINKKKRAAEDLKKRQDRGD